MQNPYGNYFIQDIIDGIYYNEFKEREALNSEIINNIIHLSNQKFSSNVVIKFLNNCSLEDKKRSIINFFNLDQLALLKKNKYLVNVINKIVDQMGNSEIIYYLGELSKNSKLQYITSILSSKLK